MGNLANFDGWSYVYDAHNRLIEANGPSTTVVLSYDAIGRLTRTVHNGQVIDYLYDGNELVAEYNSAGSLLQAHQYDAYGNPKHSSSARFRYTGQILIPGTELYYYKARVYHPKLGRFMQTDPIGYQDGMNWYAYVGNDPLNLRDPTGLCGTRIRGVISAGCKVYGDTSGLDAQQNRRDQLSKEFRESIAEAYVLGTNNDYDEYIKKVRTGGIWDFKNRPEYQDLLKIEDFGNFAFGVTVAAWTDGFSGGLSNKFQSLVTSLALRGAGFYQKHYQRYEPSNGNWYDLSSPADSNYGDQFSDQVYIYYGLRYYFRNPYQP